MNNEKDAAPASSDDDLYAQVPADFPRPVHLGAVPGVQPKLLMTKYAGRFYVPGCTPPEIFERWDVVKTWQSSYPPSLLSPRPGSEVI